MGTKYITPEIKLTELSEKQFSTDVFLEHHILVWFMSGEVKIIQADATHIFRAGDIFLVPRQLVTTVVMYPKEGQSYKAAAMHLTRDRLKRFYAKHPAMQNIKPVQKVYTFSHHPLLESCMTSLLPYFGLEELPSAIADIKIEEAVSILRAIDPNVDGLLSNFDEPGKINLVEFMERNYMFNMTMDRFSYLTGRSEATFRRDFKKTFRTTPQKWLTEKRLKLAHYYIAEKSGRPSDVYVETGFENLSHFSYAFKSYFGYSPNELRARSAAVKKND